MDIAPADNPTITYVARGEITGDRPEFTTTFGTRATYVAVGYECRFTYSGGEWSTRGITITGAARNASGKVGRRLRDVPFWPGEGDTPEWVAPLIAQVRATITL